MADPPPPPPPQGLPRAPRDEFYLTAIRVLRLLETLLQRQLEKP